MGCWERGRCGELGWGRKGQEARVVAWWLGHCFKCLNPVSEASSPTFESTQLPANASWEAAGDSPSPWVPATHPRDPWLQLGLASHSSLLPAIRGDAGASGGFQTEQVQPVRSSGVPQTVTFLSPPPRITSGSLESPSASEANPDGREPTAPAADREGSPVSGGGPFQLAASSEEDIIDLK